MKVSATPINNNVLIRLSKKNDKSDSGIILSNNDKSIINNIGVIIECDPKLNVKKGNTVIFNANKSTYIELNEDEHYALIKNKHILSYIKE
jgi:co-chaperonin GroES (HSP10)